MASQLQVQDLNTKEMKLFSALADGKKHTIKDLKKLFWHEARLHCAKVYRKGWGESEVNMQSQSFVRNSVRALVDAGWVKRAGRGTYQLLAKGKAQLSTLKKALRQAA